MNRAVRRAWLPAFLAALLLGSGGTAAWGLDRPSITLRLGLARGASSASQGQPFPFVVEAKNAGDTDEPITVTIALQSPSSGTADVIAWTVTVPAGGSATQQMAEVSAQWFLEIGVFTLTARAKGAVGSNALASTVTPATVVVPRFDDVTAARGLSTELPTDQGTSHAEGAAWGDVDGDGYPDLYVPIRDQPAQLWIYDPGLGTYTDRSADWQVTNPGGVGVSATFVDVDDDGDEDLYVVNDAMDPQSGEPTGQGNRLYRSELAQGQERFTDVSAEAGLETQGNGASASWGDYDGDGFVDLYVVTSGTYKPPITDYQQDHLFHNDGDGTFTDVTCESLPTNDPNAGFCPDDPGFGGSTGSGFEAVWLDVDGDGDQDLYLAQDLVSPHKDINRLYRNDGLVSGRWRFTDLCAGVAPPAACRGMHSMGVAVGDYDGDLWPDLAVSNTGGNGGNVLFRNERHGSFTEVAASVGVARPQQGAANSAVTWGMGFFDFNLDGTEDLYVAAGALNTDPEEPDELFVNTTQGTFLDLSAPAGVADPAAGRGVAFADLDRDGLVDAYVINVAGAPVLLRNATPASGHWLELELTGTSSNRDACGARVVLSSAGARQARWLVCGSSLGAGNDRVLHFGGVATTGFVMAVTWPSGLRQTFRGTQVDRVIELTEGQPSRLG